jgi:2-polyprenyl-6-methoxyphenol hydroxylase-like FAD-dependent oxidoreductase
MPLLRDEPHPADDVGVLVVGAGPAGLAAATELARHGIPVLLAERRHARAAHPRATLLSLRSMELMRRWGLEDAVRRRAVAVDMRMLLADRLSAAAAGTPVEVGVPSREQSRVLSPTEPACVSQDAVEPLLLARLRAQPGVRVEHGTALAGLRADGDGVRAELRDERTGATRTVRARYAIGADGASSAVRAAAGIAMGPVRDVFGGTTTIVHAPLWEVVGPHRHLLYSVAHGENSIDFLPTGPTDRWLVGHPDDEAQPDDRRIAELVRVGAGVGGLEVRVGESRRFRAAAQLAEVFRAGPVFLAGDAAHRVTPRGGTGLNLALHDGFDLGWKLAWVLRGWAAPGLLDSYEAERRPAAEHNVTRSADPGGSRRAPEREVHADLGGRIPHVWAGERSTLDLLGLGLTLFAGRARAARRAREALPATGAPVEVRVLDPIAARAVGAVGDAALLVRPDGRPAGVVPAGAVIADEDTMAA